jgi:hypothetical protein
VPTGAGQQHIVHIRQPIVDPLNFRGLCLKECIPAGRKTIRVLRIVSFGDHFPLASANRSVPSSRKYTSERLGMNANHPITVRHHETAALSRRPPD